MSEKTSSKSILSRIQNIGKMGMKFTQEVHETAKLCISHARLYHDVTLMMHLVNTLSESCPAYTANELVQWFKKHSPVKFEYNEDKKTLRNATEDKDKDGKLVREYAQEEILDKSPMHLSPETSKRTQQEIEPISFKWFQQRAGSFLNQLKKAGKVDGRGLMGADGKVLFEGDDSYKQAFDAYADVCKGIISAAGKIIPLAVMPQTETLRAANKQKKDKLIKQDGTKPDVTTTDNNTDELKSTAKVA